MIIRRAKKSDAPELMRLLVQIDNVHSQIRPDIFEPGVTKYTTEEIETIVENDDMPVYVCEDGGKLIAHLFAIKEDDMRLGKHLYIDDLCVDESARRLGVGQQMMDYVAEDAKKMGCKRLTLNVWKGNIEGENFYDKIGFKPLKTFMEKIL